MRKNRTRKNRSRKNRKMNGGNPSMPGMPQLPMLNVKGGARSTVGSKVQVWNGTAKRTSGGLHKKDLMRHKNRIVSKKKHAAGKKAIKHLIKLGYKAKKGTFKLFKKGKRGGFADVSGADMNMNEASSFEDMSGAVGFKNML